MCGGPPLEPFAITEEGWIVALQVYPDPPGFWPTNTSWRSTARLFTGLSASDAQASSSKEKRDSRAYGCCGGSETQQLNVIRMGDIEMQAGLPTELCELQYFVSNMLRWTRGPRRFELDLCEASKFSSPGKYSLKACQWLLCRLAETRQPEKPDQRGCTIFIADSKGLAFITQILTANRNTLISSAVDPSDTRDILDGVHGLLVVRNVSTPNQLQSNDHYRSSTSFVDAYSKGDLLLLDRAVCLPSSIRPLLYDVLMPLYLICCSTVLLVGGVSSQQLRSFSGYVLWACAAFAYLIAFRAYLSRCIELARLRLRWIVTGTTFVAIVALAYYFALLPLARQEAIPVKLMGFVLTSASLAMILVRIIKSCIDWKWKPSEARVWQGLRNMVEAPRS